MLILLNNLQLPFYESLIQIRTCNQRGFVVDKELQSIVIKSPTVIAVVVSVGAVAAVLVLTSAESIESLFVVIIVVPFLFTSHTEAPVTHAVSTYAPISVIVPVNGNSKAPQIFVHTALSVAFSMAYISTYRTFRVEATNWSTGIARVESVQVFISAVVASSTFPARVRDDADTKSVTSESVETTPESALTTPVNQTGRVTVPVNVGEAVGAFALICA